MIACWASRSAAGAERGPHRQFLLPADAARQHQVGDVDAGHQQDHPDPGEQHQQGRPHLSDHLFVQRRNRGGPPGVGVGIGLLEPRGDRRDAGARLFDARARRQPSDCGQVVHVPDQLTRLVDHPRPGEEHRRPHVDLHRAGEAGRTDHAAIGEDEVGRHHPDDGRRFVVDRHGLADDAGIAAEAALPVAVAQHQLAGGVALAQRAAELRGAAEQGEESRLDKRGDDHFGRAVDDQRGVGDERKVTLERGDAGALLAEIAKVGRRDRVLGLLLLGVVAPHHHQLSRLGVGQRLQQDALHHGEDGAVGADAQRQRGHGEPGVERRLQGLPEGEADVGAQRVPEHGVSPGRFVEVRGGVGKEGPAHDRRPTLGQPVADQRADRQRTAAAEVVAHLGREAAAEGARIGEQAEPEQSLGNPRPARRGHARTPFSSRRARAAVTWPSSREASARATATPRGVSA